ncbi:MAG: imidazole glycerol phosphate synthase subunit HisH [Chloroflexi bacterium]|nr:imidazole glycerol phosphate synthase subunit HisH [Chloroflexota bacterium]
MSARIAIINTRAANLHSVSKALEKVGASAEVTSDPEALKNAAGVVLPGVGASDAVMRAINSQGFAGPVKKYAASGRPLLCICVGMQVLFDGSDEGEIPALGLLAGRVERFPRDLREDGKRLKVPHMGWNLVKFTPEAASDSVFSGIPQDSYFYFVHSYRCLPADPSVIAGTTRYGEDVCAAVLSGEVAGTQFHPEKSGDLGLEIYRNFVRRVG